MLTQAEQLAHLATIIAKALVDRPNDVRVNATAGEHAVVLNLSVHPDDVGKVIGKNGVHAGAMRRLLSAAAGKLKRSVMLEVVDPLTDRGSGRRDRKDQSRR